VRKNLRPKSLEEGVSQAAGEAVLAKLSEVLFVETLRLYIARLPPEQTGWLAGARDAEVGKTLALMHRNPAQPWTIATLAQEAGVSRSVLAEVGYESEAAFNRAFKRHFTVPPARFRSQARSVKTAKTLADSVNCGDVPE